MGKIFVILGKSASGKDTIFHEIIRKCPDLNQVILYTTRPKRKGETNGKEYYFCTQESMSEFERNGKIIELRKYDTVHGPWYYFTADDGQILLEEKDYLMISTLEGFEKIRDYFGKGQVVPLYIVLDDFERIHRSLARESRQNTPCVAEVCRRFLADESDFSKERIEKAGIDVSYPNNNLEHCVNEIISTVNNAR
ncbi:MAG: guanylate kinase [Lachnoclostridium sp.]|jgi:guanylate kinase|nr:guanylate kinase [Lachnoclostridium sp.]